jgi:hypothetical protein
VPDQPALPCPSWCTTDHTGSRSGISHQAVRRAGSDIEVALFMTDYGTDAPSLASLDGAVDIFVTWMADDPRSIRNASRPLAESEQFAGIAEAFGRPDVAALIRELAALAGQENPDGT